MAARANWKGYLRLSLVSCSVALYPAVTSTSRLKCHTINRKTGNRIREEVVDAITEEPVEREDRVMTNGSLRALPDCDLYGDRKTKVRGPKRGISVFEQEHPSILRSISL